MIDFTDNTGKLVSLKDIDDAISAAKSLMPRIVQISAISPEAAVNIGNVLRCLQELKAIREYAAPEHP